MSDFDKAFALVIDHEGGYSNDPRDPGGETKFGISKRSYPNVDIAALTLGEAKAIYLKDFWEPLDAFNLPEQVTFVLFDMAVNMGKGAAARCLQRALGVQADGIIGPVTRDTVKTKDWRALLGEMTVQRIMFYSTLQTFQTYGLGWTRRSIKTLMEVL